MTSAAEGQAGAAEPAGKSRTNGSVPASRSWPAVVQTLW